MAANYDSKIGLEWDEDRGGDRTPENYISCPDLARFYISTRKALPWEPSRHESGRVIIPSVWLENLFRMAKVEGAHSLNSATDRFLVRGLGLKEYLAEAIDLLLDEDFRRADVKPVCRWSTTSSSRRVDRR